MTEALQIEWSVLDIGAGPGVGVRCDLWVLIWMFLLFQVDCLNPANHQRLCVLFSSSSAQSSNAPSACVSPW